MNKKFWTTFLIMGLLDISHKQIVSRAIAEAAATRQQKITSSVPKKGSLEEYIAFFEEVYATMQKNYYQDIPREAFDAFVEKFKTSIYSQLKSEKKSDDYVRWRSAAYLVDNLKSSEDVFSAFYPPEPAKEYEESALGIKMDLGIDGNAVERGLEVTRVEPRSDAYTQGLREKNIVVAVGETRIAGMEKEKIIELLTPLIDSTTTIAYLDHQDGQEKSISVLSKEYFKQDVFMEPTALPWVYKIDIKHFNRMTGEDLFRLLQFYRQQGPILGLVIDLRGNPGGPPLAAREISSMFLPGGEQFAYFQKKGQPPSMLDVPVIPSEYRYDGPIVILVDKKSGSASELFSGVLQKRGRAVLMGTNSAGQVMLKSMFHFEDKSMVLLVVARGHHPDGSVFSFDGLVPDRRVEENENDAIMKYALKYLMYVNVKK